MRSGKYQTKSRRIQENYRFVHPDLGRGDNFHLPQIDTFTIRHSTKASRPYLPHRLELRKYDSGVEIK